MHIQPLGNRLVVKLVKKANTSASGIIIATEEKDEQSVGEVTALGSGQGTEENIKDLGIKVGDKVLFSKYGGEEVKDVEEHDTVYKILNGKDVMAILK